MPDKSASWVHLSAFPPLFGADKWFGFDTVNQLSSPAGCCRQLALTTAEKKRALCNIPFLLPLSSGGCFIQGPIQMSVRRCTSCDTYGFSPLPGTVTVKLQQMRQFSILWDWGKIKPMWWLLSYLWRWRYGTGDALYLPSTEKPCPPKWLWSRSLLLLTGAEQELGAFFVIYACFSI